MFDYNFYKRLVKIDRKLSVSILAVVLLCSCQPEAEPPLRMQIPPSETFKTFQGLKLPTLKENHQLLSGTPSPLDQISESLSHFMLDRKILEKSINNKLISDARLLPVIQK